MHTLAWHLQASQRNAKGDDKFVSVAWRSSEAGAVYIDDSALAHTLDLMRVGH